MQSVAKMPLIDITNSQAVSSLNRKRSHDQFAKEDGDADKLVAAPTALDKFVKVMGDSEFKSFILSSAPVFEQLTLTQN